MANKLFSQLLKDTYNGLTSYTVGDIVTYNGSSYACRLNSLGNLPTNTIYWALLAEKGDKGDQGDQGPAGVGATVVTTLGNPGLDTNVPSEKLMRTNLDLKDTKTDLTKYSNLYAPEGFLINGKIVPTVSSGNLTVSIKGLDGNNPSSLNPVYVRIGDTIRAITSALSVTTNAGTNWCNAGRAELATREIDYFVYLGYNATDGITIGFSRIPYATLYSDFSTTTTNDKYCAISTITNAIAGDNYRNIGRFAAKLSAGAGYTWTVPTFTASNLIQRPIFETRVLTFTATLTAETTNPTIGSGGSQLGRYIIEGNRCNVDFYIGFGSSGVNPGIGLYRPMLPISCSSVSAVYFGIGNMYDSTSGITQTTSFQVAPFYFTDRIYLITTTGNYSNVTNSVPWDWSTSDNLGGQVVYTI